jgi:GNAT superfamily N-acetyltransferase
MVRIIYRHYESGDEQGLAELFNISFQQNGAGFNRSTKNWVWRYVQSPGFEPEMCQIAVDIDNDVIIGAVYANPLEIIPIGVKNYLVGDINDVSCHPNYTKRGIATNLMKMALDYMKEKGCDYSILSTGYEGFARKKLYKKYGFFDYDQEFQFVQFPNIFQLVKNLFGTGLLIPAFFILSYLPRYLTRLRIKNNSFFKDFTYEINQYCKHSDYMESMNQLIPKYYEGFRKYDDQKFKWARIKVPSNQEKPTYILIKKAGSIVGGATLTHHDLFALKFGVKMRIGIIHDPFLNKTVFKNRKDLFLGYKYLIDKVLRASTRRFLTLLIYQSSLDDRDINEAFRGMSFLKIKGTVIMIKELKENLKFPKLNKPLYVPTYTSLGFP